MTRTDAATVVFFVRFDSLVAAVASMATAAAAAAKQRSSPSPTAAAAATNRALIIDATRLLFCPPSARARPCARTHDRRRIFFVFARAPLARIYSSVRGAASALPMVGGRCLRARTRARAHARAHTQRASATTTTITPAAQRPRRRKSLLSRQKFSSLNRLNGAPIAKRS